MVVGVKGRNQHTRHSMFPEEWETRTLPKRRRKTPATTPEGGAAAEQDEFSEVEASVLSEEDKRKSGIAACVMRSLNTATEAPATPGELDLDVILTRMPYRDILENLFGRDTYEQPDVPVIARAYEEAFMRESFAGERPCVAGEMCEAMHIDPTTPFVCTEFLLPSETTSPPKDPQFCVLCSRKTTQKLFYDILLAGRQVGSCFF